MQFYSNKNEGTSEFEKYLVSQSIKHIPSRGNNPQTNGKLERFWYEHKKYRWRFNSLQEFLKWYNRRIYGSLDYRNGENPGMALIRKMLLAAIIRLFFSGVNNSKNLLIRSRIIIVLNTVITHKRYSTYMNLDCEPAYDVLANSIALN